MRTRLKRINEKVFSSLKKEVRDDLEPVISHVNSKKKLKSRIPAVVGLSGGADSIATLYIAKKIGFSPVAVTLDYGRSFYDSNYRKDIRKIARKLAVKSIFVPIDKRYFNLLTRQLKSGKKPCKSCVRMKVKQLEDVCRKMKISFLIWGDIASRENPIEVIDKKLVRISLPSLFYMNEKDMICISKKVTQKNVIYACPVPYMIKMRNIKLNDELKLFWIKKLKRWRENLDEAETLRLLKNVAES